MLRAALLIFIAMLQPLAAAMTTEETSLKLMTFNIRYGTADDGKDSWPNRDHLVMQVLRDHDAPIVGLQEALAFQIDEITTQLPQYAVIGVGRDDGITKGEYAAILYRPDRFVVDSSGTFWLSDTPEVVGSRTWGNANTRICTWARFIDRTNNKAFYVYNTHFDYRSHPSRIESAMLVADRIGTRLHDDPVILMGDFNAGENSEEIVAILTGIHGPEFINTYREIHPDTTEVGTYNDFKGDTHREMVDHVFVSPGIKTIDANIDHFNDDGRYPSDHYPVWATIELP